MAVSKKRRNDFQRDLKAIIDEIGFKEYYDIFEAQLLDYATRLQAATGKPPTRAEIYRAINRAYGPYFEKYANQVFAKYDDIVSAVNLHYGDIADDVGRSLSRVNAIEKVIATEIGNFKDVTLSEIAKTLRKDLLAGKKQNDIRKNLIKIGGKTAAYADAISETQLQGYGRTLKQEKARIGEVLYFEYVGIIRKTTRPFCRALVGQTKHLSEIKKMKNGNLEPVSIYCGGWRCKHDWEPDPFFEE